MKKVLLSNHLNSVASRETVNNFDSRKALLGLLLFLCLIVIAGPAVAVTATSEQTIRYITQTNGPQVPVAQMPLLYAKLGELFDRVSEAQAQMLELHITSNQLLIVDSEKINAFVTTVKPQGVTRAKNFIVITTGLLYKVIDENIDAQQVLDRLLELTGFLAHELGHPLDKLDPDGIEKEYGKMGAQGREVRADTDGMAILIAAGLPPDLVSRALRRIRPERSATSGFISSVSTHPESNLRLTMQRSILTIRKFIEGESQLTGPNELSTEEGETILNELDNLDSLEYRVRIPKDLNELLSFLEPQPQKTVVVKLVRDGQALREFNAWVLWFDQNLATNPSLDPASLQLALKIRTLLYEKNVSICSTLVCLDRVFKKVQGVEFLKGKTHGEYVRELGFYSGQGAPINTESNKKNLFPFFWRNQAIFSSLSKMNLNDVLQFISYNFTADDVLTRFTPEDILAWSEYVSGEFRIRLEAELNTTYARQYDFPYFLPTPRSRSLWQGLLNRSKNQNLRSPALQTLQLIWENRGFWAYLEFSSEKEFNIDWDFIGKSLDLDHTQINHQVQREFKKFIREKYMNLPARKEIFHERFFGPSNPGITQLLENGKLTPPRWLSLSMPKYTRKCVLSHTK